MEKRPAIFLFLLLLLFHLSAEVTAQAQDRPGKVTIQPDHLSMGLLFGGGNIHLKAEIPAGCDAVVRVLGADKPLEFKIKGKKFGLIWMNKGEVSFQAMPSLYIIHSSRKLGELAVAATLKDLEIGYDALRSKVISDADPRADALFGDLVKLKEKDGLFCTREGSVSILPGGKKEQEISCDFLLPAKTPVGDYAIDVFGFSGGKGILLATAKVNLARGPMIAFITSMAEKQGLLYGCLAVAIALIAGLLTGFICGLGKNGAH